MSTPGCVVGVERRGHAPLVRAFGLANLQAPVGNDTSTVFEAGAVSKQVTATAVTLLAAGGKLALDDDLRRFFPAWPVSMPRITIRQLLHHQSGLREWSDLVDVQGWPRGTRAHVPSQLVARVTGESFAACAQRAIVAPLGMAHPQ